jgi:positive regulator of sigma E activity
MIFHLLVILKVLPGDIVWGGTFDESSLVKYEIIAFFITGFLLFIAIVKAGYINNTNLKKVANFLIWIMVIYFAFMIFGNMTAKTLTEKVIFIPLSFIMFISSIRLGLGKE